MKPVVSRPAPSLSICPWAGFLRFSAPFGLVLGLVLTLSLAFNANTSQAGGPPVLWSDFNLPIRLEVGRSPPVRFDPGLEPTPAPTPEVLAASDSSPNIARTGLRGAVKIKG